MAGIGFRLARMAREGGIGGVAGAAIHGAVISSGPWLLAAGAVLALERWSTHHAARADAAALQAVLIYAFSVSAVLAAPVVMLTTRAVADRLFARESGAVPGLLVAALAAVTLLALAAGALLYALGGLAPIDQLLATTILALLSQIWVLNLFLTALRRYRTILIAYLAGIAPVLLGVLAIDVTGLTLLLAMVGSGLAITAATLLVAIRRSFAAVARWPDDLPRLARDGAHIALAGLAAALALWIDKWLLWVVADDSVPALGMLHHNPVHDPASFLGLLSLVPGLTLVLIVTETRFDRQFARLMAACTRAGTFRRIEQARKALARGIAAEARLLVVAQAAVACLLWVLAPRLFDAIGADPRGIFAFRFTVVGAVFHLMVVFATIVLAYFDLYGRILMIWTIFALASAAGTLVALPAGFAGYGQGYLAGAIVAASVSVALVAQALGQLGYLLFVGNNPAVMGGQRRWA